MSDPLKQIIEAADEAIRNGKSLNIQIKQCSSQYPMPKAFKLLSVQCQREAGHRPQTWHRHEYEDEKGGVVEWSFTDEERADWKERYGK